MAATVVLGFLLALAGTIVSLAILVRARLSRAPHAVTLVPVPLVFYNAWIAWWFLFECLREFLLTRIDPVSAMRLAAVVLLAASLCSMGWLYGCVLAVHHLLGDRTSRPVWTIARYGAIAGGVLLVAGWSVFEYNGDSALFVLLRSLLAMVVFPLALAAWIWLGVRGRGLADAAWRASVVMLARRQVVMVAAMLLLAATRERLGAAVPALPLVLDLLVALGYMVLTVLFVEAEHRRAASRPPHQAIP